ncbi:lamin tail domain-containing protein [Streptomyces sp. NPDC005355]|uniref:lamin tail domain-containing protein n=1 Tax=Streptomyces sp. NPDC005355 TaxID=3157038 RepID=UPI00339DBEBC
MSASAITAITRRMTAAALAAGALVGAVSVSASADDHLGRHHHWPHPSAVEISDVQADSPGWDDGSNRSLNAEWVEVTNTSRRRISLEGWTLRNADGDRYRFGDLLLAGGSTVRIHTGFGRDTSQDVYQDRRHYIWDNRSDRATLHDDEGSLIDTTAWGRSHR